MSEQPRPGPHDDYWYGPRGGMSAAGQNVTVDTAMQLSTVYACDRVLSETVASRPLNVYRRDANGTKKQADQHPLARLLRTAPAPGYTAYRFTQFGVHHLDLRGNSLSRIRIGATGQVDSLTPLAWDRITVRFDNGKVFYEYTPAYGPRDVFLPDEVLHIRGLSEDGVVGLSPIAVQRNTIGKALAAGDYGSRFFANDARPGTVVFKHPKSLSDIAYSRLKGEIESKFTGANRFRPLLTEDGMEMETLSVSNEDAQFLETLGFNRTEICAIMRVPPHKVADLSRSTFSNIEHQSLEFVNDSIAPLCRNFEQEINAHPALLGDDGAGQEGFYCEFDLSELLRGDLLSRMNSYWIGIQGGVLSPNEARAREGMNAREGGDVFLTPQNMGVAPGQPGYVAPQEQNNNDTSRRTGAHLEVVNGR
jgi:HK97 family phage portal protein